MNPIIEALIGRMGAHSAPITTTTLPIKSTVSWLGVKACICGQKGESCS
jgi:hypothetical protein